MSDAPGALDAAAPTRGGQSVAQRLRQLRQTVAAIRAETPVGHMAHTHAGLALVTIDDLIAAAATPRTARREVVVLTFRVATASNGDGLSQWLQEWIAHQPESLVLDYERPSRAVVRVPEPYEPGAAFRPEGAQGGPDGGC